MIDTSDFTTETWLKLEIMADDMGVSVDELLTIIDASKHEFYKTQLS